MTEDWEGGWDGIGSDGEAMEKTGGAQPRFVVAAWGH
jgi:hypothetical protein